MPYQVKRECFSAAVFEEVNCMSGHEQLKKPKIFYPCGQRSVHGEVFVYIPRTPIGQKFALRLFYTENSLRRETYWYHFLNPSSPPHRKTKQMKRNYCIYRKCKKWREMIQYKRP